MNPNRLRSEIKKRKPFESAEEEALLHLLRTSDLFQNRLGKLFRQFGLTPSQYNVLRILRGEGKPLPTLEIADRMIQVVPAMTGLLDRLEKQNWITRERCTHDRRIVYIEITPAAKQLLKRLDQPLQQLHSILLGHLKPRQLKELSSLLELARANVPRSAVPTDDA